MSGRKKMSNQEKGLIVRYIITCIGINIVIIITFLTLSLSRSN